MFETIEMAPADPILGLNEAFNLDKKANKVNLGVGVYKNEEGKTPILNSVKAAERINLEEEKTKSYLPIDGKPSYKKVVQKLVFGANSEIVNSGRAATIQAPGGTGGIKLAADFIKKFYPGTKVWISDPTWANHKKVFNSAGLETRTYPYYNPKTNGLDFDGMYKTLSEIPGNDLVLFHACCHNPTGVDISPEQWKKLASLSLKKSFIPFFDFAYQGFGNGLKEDAVGIRTFAEKVKSFLVSNSFSKNFGLYNERIGALSIVTPKQKEAAKVLSQLKICARTNYSNPPSHGSSIVTTILSTPDLRTVWEDEVKEMRDRINSYRNIFVENLKVQGCKKNFDFIKKQHGMFSYTGLTKDKVIELREKYSIYFVNSGRINLAGLNGNNIDYVCKAFTEVLND
ncbi:MAG: aspartate/tyrosine/aromatic aminotransferase [Victivallales bacterium]|nr:aspartate/tyrosine/aromatic aminotransferase [Victivallales bacterium]